MSEILNEADVLAISDEDFMKLPPEPEYQEEIVPVVEDETPPVDINAEEILPEPAEELVEGEIPPTNDDDEDNFIPSSEPEGEEFNPSNLKTEVTEPDKEKVTEPEVEPKTVEVITPGSEINYEEAYKQIMAPFKANGKEVSLDNPEQVIQLMQMGANYTKKLQALQPSLKLVKMLENNDLLDEGKLSYLIDLDKKKPEAINQLVKDSKIDPLDLDVTGDASYEASDHSVSDVDMNFDRAVSEVISSDSGKAVLTEIDSSWDTKSKDMIFNDPDILRFVAKQKQHGIFDAVVAEVDKQRMLGNLNDMPYIRAYIQVGQEMDKNGAFNKVTTPATSALSKRVIETKVATRNNIAPASNAQVKAVAPVRTAPKKIKQEINPLSMSDEDFMKNDKISQYI
ncbi:MAG: hypothetical protein COA63_014130 [Methylophaga sp.]|nr:hypothetical protein [Methylophaga sp.]